jgi:uncharacterized alkaline shock family protein YloU
MLPDNASTSTPGKGAQPVSSTDTQSTGQSPLHTDLGTTTIQDSVVTAIIGTAAEEVEGVAMSHGGVSLPGDTSPTVGEFVDNITGSASRTRGLSVDVGEQQAAADITINVEYGRPIPKVTQAVRKRVIERVENLTGLKVTEVNIQVNDVILPES